jgi:hypothetical protein
VAASWIPAGFEAYARILHPALERDGAAPVRWADVSRWSGVEMHPRVQWHEVALPEITPPGDPPWSGQGPREGSLSLADATELSSILSSRSPGNCYFALWEGYGGGLVLEGPLADEIRRVSESPVVEVPWRTYELYEGPVAAATSFATTWFQSPNLWWPESRTWCVSSEIDLAWTYVAGSRDLIDELLADTDLEVLVASPEDSTWATLPTWLAERVAAATDALLESDSVTMELSLGSVSLRLERASRRRCALVTRSERTNEWSSSTTILDKLDGDELRRRIAFAVERAVIHLVS